MRERSFPLVTLLPEQEMEERLVRVHNTHHTCQKLYPLWLKEAGQRKQLNDVAMLVISALHEYTEPLVDLLASQLFALAPEFAAAMVSGSDAAQTARELTEKLLTPKPEDETPEELKS